MKSIPSHSEASSFPPGYISRQCRFRNQDGSRLIYVNNVLTYFFKDDDKTGLRVASVFIILSGLASQIEIAQAWRITNKTVFNWVKKAKTEGIGGLIDKQRPGAPIKMTDKVKRTILRYRKQGFTLVEICRLTNLSHGAVCTFLYPKLNSSVLIVGHDKESPNMKTTADFDTEKASDSVKENELEIRCVESNGTRLVFVNEIQVYSLETSDKLSCRFAAVQLHLSQKLRQEQIALGWGSLFVQLRVGLGLIEPKVSMG